MLLSLWNLWDLLELAPLGTTVALRFLGTPVSNEFLLTRRVPVATTSNTSVDMKSPTPTADVLYCFDTVETFVPIRQYRFRNITSLQV